MKMTEFFKRRVLVWVILIIWRLLCITVRSRAVIDEQASQVLGSKEALIYLFWHGQGFYLLYFFLDLAKNTVVIVSSSEDGNLSNDIMTKLNYRTIRGSSFSHPIYLLRQLKRELDKNQNVAITGDGSRGPHRELQSGSLKLSKISHSRSVLPVAVSFGRYWELKSWDKFQIPKPFTTATVVIGKPCNVAPDATKDVMNTTHATLADEMNRINNLADKLSTSSHA